MRQLLSSNSLSLLHAERFVRMALDSGFLTRKRRPAYERSGRRCVSVVDLFCGCGGLTLGLAEALRRGRRSLRVPLAVDWDLKAATVFKRNFPAANVVCGPVEGLFDGEDGDPLTIKERRVRKLVGNVDVLVGGPPCQGHSNLNNHTRRTDRRNSLHWLLARAAVVLQPRIVIIENVPDVLRDKKKVVERTRDTLLLAGFGVGDGLVDLCSLGLPQKRRRHLLIAGRNLPVELSQLFADLIGAQESQRDVRWAIESTAHGANGDPLSVPSAVTPANVKRIKWLFANKAYDLPDRLRPRCHRDEDHSYKSVYGRLRWDLPSQTITGGFGSMGQGRFVHPSRSRTLTPREAARLQFFPDFFDFTPAVGRTAWAELIGNAVPPLLTLRLGSQLIESGLL